MTNTMVVPMASEIPFWQVSVGDWSHLHTLACCYESRFFSGLHSTEIIHNTTKKTLVVRTLHATIDIRRPTSQGTQPSPTTSSLSAQALLEILLMSHPDSHTCNMVINLAVNTYTHSHRPPLGRAIGNIISESPKQSLVVSNSKKEYPKASTKKIARGGCRVIKHT